MQRTKDLDTAELLEHLPALQLLLFRVLGCQVILWMLSIKHQCTCFTHNDVSLLLANDGFDCTSIHTTLLHICYV